MKTLIESSIDQKQNQLTYSGAYSPIYLVKKRDGEVTDNDLSDDTHYLQKLKGDTQPIGNYFNMQPFSTHTALSPEEDGAESPLEAAERIANLGAPKKAQVKKPILPKSWLAHDEDLVFDTVDVVVKAEVKEEDA